MSQGVFQIESLCFAATTDLLMILDSRHKNIFIAYNFEKKILKGHTINLCIINNLE